MLYLVLFALSYSVFVFISEKFNPFVITVLPFKRRRWRLARQTSVIVFVVGLACLVSWQFLGIDRRFLGAIFFIVTFLFLIPCLLRYKHKGVWS